MEKRETFSSKFGLLMTMIGVAVGLGNIWRFPYMVGKFGGAGFVLLYAAAVFTIGIPALMAEWALGRYTRRGTLGAFEKGGLPGGKYVGMFFFFVVLCATAYYTNLIGWVGYYGIAQVINLFGGKMEPATILPPDGGFDPASFMLQALMTAVVILGLGMVLVKGLRRGIEKASKFIMPTFFVLLVVLIIRAVTLPGSGEGVRWFIGSLSSRSLSGTALAAAVGQAVFSLSLGGTFMVVYGSYMKDSESIPRNTVITGIGDLLAGILVGFVIFPAVFSFGLPPDSGPGLIFHTLPRSFSLMPAAELFALLFFLGLFGAAYLSDVAAFEVLVAGLTDNAGIKRNRAVWLICGAVFLLAVPPMINLKIFVPWDLTFGSGMQTLGAVLAVLTTVWCMKKSEALKEFAKGSGKTFPLFLYWWMRVVIPLAILFVGVNWLLDSVFGIKIFGSD